MQEINPALIYDLQKYHPEAWQHFLSYKNDFIRGSVIDNIRRGKAEGYYRPEIDENVMARIRVETIQMSFDLHLFPKAEFNMPDVKMQVFDHFVYGLLTTDGYNKYKEYHTVAFNPPTFNHE